MRNAGFNTHDIKKCCENKLEINFKKGGKEFNGWVVVEGIKTARITIPKGRKKVQPGTYGSMATQLRLRITEFDDLLECTLSKDGYLQILGNQSAGQVNSSQTV